MRPIHFGATATILFDSGLCFVGRGGRRKPPGSWTLTLFENELLNLDTGLISSRQYPPQANGKSELLHHCLEDEIWGSRRVKDIISDIPEEYRKRWGIETGYRNIGFMRAKTRSMIPGVRQLLFLFSAAVANLWTLANYVAAGAKDGIITPHKWIPHEKTSDGPRRRMMPPDTHYSQHVT